MNQRLNVPTALLLTVPPLMWAGNAAVGTMFFKQPMSGMQALGSVLSMAGVVVVLTRSDVARFGQIQLVPDHFSAVSSAAFLGEPPELYHALAFALIVCGIVVSSRR